MGDVAFVSFSEYFSCPKKGQFSKKNNHFLSFNLLPSSFSKNLIPPFQPPIQVVQTEKLRIAANEHFVLRRFWARSSKVALRRRKMNATLGVSGTPQNLYNMFCSSTQKDYFWHFSVKIVAISQNLLRPMSYLDLGITLVLKRCIRIW